MFLHTFATWVRWCQCCFWCSSRSRVYEDLARILKMFLVCCWMVDGHILLLLTHEIVNDLGFDTCHRSYATLMQLLIRNCWSSPKWLLLLLLLFGLILVMVLLGLVKLGAEGGRMIMRTVEVVLVKLLLRLLLGIIMLMMWSMILYRVVR